MSVTNIGLVESTAYEPTTGLRVYESGDGDAPSGRTIYLTWETEYGNPPNVGFSITFKFTGLLKGKTGYMPQKTWTVSPKYASLTTKAIGNSDGRVRWFYAISAGNLSGLKAVNGGTWLYKDRVCDTVTMNVAITPSWGSNDPMGDGSTAGDTAQATVYVGYLAAYTVTSAYYEDADTFCIAYDTTWTRKDDRYAIGSGSYVTTDYSQVAVNGQWGTITAPGLIKVPKSDLKQYLAGKVVHFELTFNPYYRPAAYFAQTWSGELSVAQVTECNGVNISVAMPANDPYGLMIGCTDAGDYGVACTEARVRVHGRGFEDWFVEKTVEVGKLEYISPLPLNVPLVIEAVGVNGAAVSARTAAKTYAGIDAPGLCIVQAAESGSGNRLLLRYNMEFGIDSEADSTTLKLAGRERSSAFYGTGGSKSITVKGDLLDEVGYTIERMPFLGDAHILLPDGRAYRCNATAELSFENSRIKSVTVKGEEVSA